MTYVKFNQPSLKSVDSFLDSLLNEFPAFPGNSFHFPPANIYERKDAYELELNVPGRNKDDFKITVDKNVLTISFDKKDEPSNEDTKQIKREFSLQSFKRSFTFDEKVNADNIAARYENGLLLVSLPKKEEVKPEVKQIAVS
ncbi:MAG TPA: Hsp20/alpha crystallin family protein [Chitinophagaceae bacterium]|nr:Hsp20/alpha crystallin family protein [Chitinophagaceae bacterium]